MKKILKTSLVMVVLLTTLNASAGSSDAAIELKNEKGKKLYFTLNEMKNVKLSIYDNSDNLLFDENVTANGKVSRTYDLSALPTGAYFIEAESDLKISRYKVDVDNKEAKFSKVAVSEVYKPVYDYKSDNGSLKLNLQEDLKTPVTVYIYDNSHNLVYTKTNTVAAINKNYNLNGLDGKECTFVLSYGGKTFEKSFPN